MLGGKFTLQALEAHLCHQPSHQLLSWRGGGTCIYCSLCVPVAPSRLNNQTILHNHLNSLSMRNNSAEGLHQIFVGARWGFVNALSRIRNHSPPPIRLPACTVCMRFTKQSGSVPPMRASHFIIWVQAEMTVDILWECFHVTLLSSETPTMITRRVYQHVHLYWVWRGNESP